MNEQQFERVMEAQRIISNNTEATRKRLPSTFRIVCNMAWKLWIAFWLFILGMNGLVAEQTKRTGPVVTNLCIERINRQTFQTCTMKLLLPDGTFKKINPLLMMEFCDDNRIDIHRLTVNAKQFFGKHPELGERND